MKKELVTSEVMYDHIRLWAQSGQSQKSYCQQADIAYHIFHYWYGKYRKEHSGNSSFIQLPISTSSGGACFAECILVSGARIVLHQPVAAHYLKTLAG